jgi:hypothetical protein
MKTIEIKYKVWKVLLTIILFFLIFLPMNITFYNFFFIKNKFDWFIIVYALLINSLYFYFSIFPFFYIIKNYSIITFTNDELIFRKLGKLYKINWNEIKSIYIEYGRSNYLYIECNNFTKVLRLSFLDKGAKEISKLIEIYRK